MASKTKAKNIVLEERGYFWWHGQSFPANHFAPADSTTGVLAIEDDGSITLELDGLMPHEGGSLSPLLRLAEEPKDETRYIEGILKESSKRVLLMDLRRSGGRFSSDGISYDRFRALSCLAGPSRLPERKEDLLGHGLELSLDAHEEWLRLGSIQVKKTKASISARYKPQRPIHYKLNDGRLSISFHVGAPAFTHQSKEVSLRERAYLAYLFTKPLPLLEVRTRFSLIEDLLILLSDSDHNLDWPLVTMGAKKHQYRLYYWRTKTSVEPPDWFQCPTTFPVIRENFGQIVETWKRKRETVGPGVFLYLATRRGMQMYAEHRFASLVWGLESFHRSAGGAGSKALEKKVQRIGAAMSCLSAADRRWLDRKLTNAAEPSLAERMFESLRGLPMGLEEKRLREFSEACARLRNDISHFGGKRNGGQYKSVVRECGSRANALSVLYHALLLREIGVEASLVTRWVTEGHRSYWIKRVFVDAGLLDAEVLKPKAGPSGLSGPPAIPAP